jgi:hypothetical protein
MTYRPLKRALLFSTSPIQPGLMSGPTWGLCRPIAVGQSTRSTYLYRLCETVDNVL